MSVFLIFRDEFQKKIRYHFKGQVEVIKFD